MPRARNNEMKRKIVASMGAVVIVAAVATAAFAADPGRSAGYLDDAKKLLEKGDARAAVIQLKNAVQADPDSGLARFELGGAEMRLADYLSAEKELRAALDRQFDRD